jgi:hypothetical protein
MSLLEACFNDLAGEACGFSNLPNRINAQILQFWTFQALSLTRQAANWL